MSKSSFSRSQTAYLTVMALVYLGDWLQGSYTYSLYKSMGFSITEIAWFTIAGFCSSAIFGTVVGASADVVGRKKACMSFCIFYGLCCVTKLSSRIEWILIGRVLGGISTSLLYSTFEAWMVCNHNMNKYPVEWIQGTFAWSTFINGLMAIISGFIANYLVDEYGITAPFILAGSLMIPAFLLIFFLWNENRGSDNRETKAKKESIPWLQILAIGTIQSTFEASMYTFVFLWSPVLESLSKDAEVPFGLVFSVFMMCIMLGSSIFNQIIKLFNLPVIFPIIFFTATASFAIAARSTSFNETFAYFNVFEICCGCYFPSIGTLRALAIPEHIRSRVMNIIRVPLNIIVVVVLLNVEKMSNYQVFGVCGGLVAIGGVASFFAHPVSSRYKQNKMKKD